MTEPTSRDWAEIPRVQMDWYRSMPPWRLMSRAITIAWRSSHLVFALLGIGATIFGSWFASILFEPSGVFATQPSWTPKGGSLIEAIRQGGLSEGALASARLLREPWDWFVATTLSSSWSGGLEWTGSEGLCRWLEYDRLVADRRFASASFAGGIGNAKHDGLERLRSDCRESPGEFVLVDPSPLVDGSSDRSADHGDLWFGTLGQCRKLDRHCAAGIDVDPSAAGGMGHAPWHSWFSTCDGWSAGRAEGGCL